MPTKHKLAVTQAYLNVVISTAVFIKTMLQKPLNHIPLFLNNSTVRKLYI